MQRPIELLEKHTFLSFHSIFIFQYNTQIMNMKSSYTSIIFVSITGNTRVQKCYNLTQLLWN